MPQAEPPVTLGQLVDLAVGTPEVGAVNFNCLHTLLHGILGHLQITDRKADLSEEQQRLIARKPDTDQESGFFSVQGPDGDDVTDSGSIAGSVAGKPKSSIRPKSSIPYHALEARMAKMEDEMKALYDLPSNAQLLKQSQDAVDGSSSGAQPVNDMWALMRLEKRVDANEQGISKLMSMMQDLMKEINGIKNEQNKLRTDLDGLNKQISELKKDVEAIGSKFEGLPRLEDLENFVTWEGLENALKGLKDSIEVKPPERVVVDMTAQTDKVETVDRPVSALSSRPASARPVSRGPSEELQALLEKLGQLTSRFDELEKRVANSEQQVSDLWEKKANKEDLAGLNSIPPDLLAQIAQMKSDIERLLNDRSLNEAALAKLQRALLDLQEELAKVASTTKDLIEENNAKQKHIEALYTFVDRLQENKADKEYVDIELDVKADKKLLDGKVSRALFDSTCEELNRLINDLLGKFSGHEEAWKKAHSQVVTDLDGKLDRLELEPLKEYLEKRIKQLDRKQVKLQAEVPAEDEAAILRQKLLTRFNCLSCDRPVDMVPGEPVQTVPDMRGFPGKQSTRPYQVYELEQLRQHARSTTLPVIQSYGGVAADATIDYYSTPRACGGGHTLTYPHNRTTKVQPQYLTQDRDEPEGAYSHKEETDIQGADGHIYRARLPKEEIRRITVSQQIRRLAQTDQRPGTSPASAATPVTGGARPSSARGEKTESQPSVRPKSSTQQPEVEAEHYQPDGASEPEQSSSPPPHHMPHPPEVEVPAMTAEQEVKQESGSTDSMNGEQTEQQQE